MTRIYPYNNKTLEGSLGGIISSMISFFLISIFFQIEFQNYFLRLLLSYVIGFLYEGFTLDIDNLTLPIIIYKVFMLMK